MPTDRFAVPFLVLKLHSVSLLASSVAVNAHELDFSFVCPELMFCEDAAIE